MQKNHYAELECEFNGVITDASWDCYWERSNEVMPIRHWFGSAHLSHHNVIAATRNMITQYATCSWLNSLVDGWIKRYIPLTLSSPVMSNHHSSKCSGPYWSSPLFLFFFDIWASDAQDWVPECPDIKKLKTVG